MIDCRKIKNQTELERKLDISKARVTQIINLLKLDSLFIQELEKLGEPLNVKIIAERKLQPYMNKSSKEQKEILSFFVKK